MGVSVRRQRPPQAPLRERIAGWRARNWRRAILAWFVLALVIMAVPAVPRTAAAIIAAGIPILLVALP
jgi:amino acid permease